MEVDKGGGTVSLQFFLLIIGLLIIANSVTGYSVIMGWGLLRDSIGYSEETQSYACRGGLSHSE